MEYLDNFKMFENKQKVSYCCVLLDNESYNKLKKLIPDDFKSFKVFCHHMTIKLGSLPKEFEDRKGEEISMKVTHIGKNDLVCAVKVVPQDKELQEYYNKVELPKFPHVTMSVDVKNGGKPFMSNKLKDGEFDKIDGPTLKGKITELYN